MDTIHGTTRKRRLYTGKNVDYFDGQPGQNGKSAYLWIRYSQNADGSGMTTDPANAKYTGYATTETNVAPTSPSVYKWQQTKGDPGIGIPGEPGTDGKTSYLHIKYSNDGGLTFTEMAEKTVGIILGSMLILRKQIVQSQVIIRGH